MLCTRNSNLSNADRNLETLTVALTAKLQPSAGQDFTEETVLTKSPNPSKCGALHFQKLPKFHSDASLHQGPGRCDERKCRVPEGALRIKVQLLRMMWVKPDEQSKRMGRLVHQKGMTIKSLILAPALQSSRIGCTKSHQMSKNFCREITMHPREKALRFDRKIMSFAQQADASAGAQVSGRTLERTLFSS